MKKNRKIPISNLVNQLNGVCKNLDMCRIKKHNPSSRISEYILFTALSYSRLEVVYTKLEVIMKHLKLYRLER